MKSDVTYSATFTSGQNALFETKEINGDLYLQRKVSGDITNEHVGDQTVSITATYQGGASVTKNVRYTVLNLNDAPTWSGSTIADQDVLVGQSLDIDGELFTSHFADVDPNAPALTYRAYFYSVDGGGVETSISNSTYPWIQIDPATADFSGTAAVALADSADEKIRIKVRAYDGTAESSNSATFDLNIINNHKPEKGSDVVRKVSYGNAMAEIDLSSVFTDVDASPGITYEAFINGVSLELIQDANVTWLSLNSTTGKFTGQVPSSLDSSLPYFTSQGKLELTVKATDRYDAVSDGDLKVTLSFNHAPNLKANAPTSEILDLDETASDKWPAVDHTIDGTTLFASFFQDSDGDAMTFSITVDAADSSVVEVLDGNDIKVKNTITAQRDITLKLNATDGTTSVSRDFVISIL